MSGKPLVALRQLELSYLGAGPCRRAVGPVDLEIREGEALGLVGESGAGKSTLALAILGLLGWRGGARTGGEMVTRLMPAEMGYIPQDPLAALDPLCSLGRMMRELGATPEDMAPVLERVNLPLGNFSLKSYPHELSGGMRQRFVIALALLGKPRLLIADEPTSSLDVTLQAEIMGLFRSILDSGVSFLFITHNLPLAALLSSRLAVMERGLLVEIGSTGEVLSSPRHPYTRKLLDAIPALEL